MFKSLITALAFGAVAMTSVTGPALSNTAMLQHTQEHRTVHRYTSGTGAA